MERSPVRKQLRRIHNVLANSRWALERSSGEVRNKWMKDLLFTLSCRRVIMLNLLDRELGILAQPMKPGQEAHRYLRKLMGSTTDVEVPKALITNCEEEEFQLLTELEELMYQPGLGGSTRQMIFELVNSARENLSDLRFIRLNLSAA